MLELRIIARGLVPSIGLLLGLAFLPYLLAGSLSVPQAESLVAEIHERRAIQAMLDRARERDVSSPTAEDRRQSAAELGKTRVVRFASLRVRRGLLVPPFSKRTTFLIEARLVGATKAEYFRVSGGRAYSLNPFWWHIRL